MQVKIGKITEYKKAVGKIFSEGNEYLFTINDLDPKDIYNINDLVTFRGEKVQNVNRAFFVEKLKK